MKVGRSWMALGLVVSLGSFAAMVDGSPAAGAVTPSISIAGAAGWEGDTGITRMISFSVALSQASTTAVSVQYRLVTGTATTADFDNLGGTLRTLSFPAGTTTKFIGVAVRPDTVDENTETFTVQLSTPVAATIRTASASGRIFDEDPGTGIRVGIGDAATSEGDSGPMHQAAFWVSLSRPSTTPVSLHAMTTDTSALAGVDYTEKMADITFAPGEVRKAFVVSVRPDLAMEPNETFGVMLMTVDGADVIDGSGIGSIISEEPVNFTTQSFLIGPFNLSATGQPGWQNESSAVAPRPAGAIGIKGMRFDIVDAAGTPVGMHDIHMHHVVMMDSSRPDAVCPSLGFNRFTGAGSERNALSLGNDYAYRVGATDSWRAMWHIMNMTAQSKSVYIKYTIDYVSATSNLAAKGVTSYWYDVDGCWGDSQYVVPGGGAVGSIHTQSSQIYTAPKAGVRVATGGHFHDGGIDITLSKVANGQAVCTNTGTYELGMLHRISPCQTMSFISAGEQFRTRVRYSNETRIPDAMGIQLTYVWEP